MAKTKDKNRDDGLLEQWESESYVLNRHSFSIAVFKITSCWFYGPWNNEPLKMEKMGGKSTWKNKALENFLIHVSGKEKCFVDLNKFLVNTIKRVKPCTLNISWVQGNAGLKKKYFKWR